LKEKCRDYVVLGRALDTETLQALKDYLEPKPMRDAIEGGDYWPFDELQRARDSERNSKVCWFDAETECPWLHEFLVGVVRDVGNIHWPLLRTSANGHLYAKYEETCACSYGPNEHFAAWHTDAEPGGEASEDGRIMSVVVVLSDSDEYTDGRFEVRDASGVITALALEAGDVVVFPSRTLEHRVSPVGVGRRRSIVFWAYDKDWVPSWEPIN